jgi:hypothetical protein
VIADAMRRAAIAKRVGTTSTVFDWLAQRLAAASDNTICANDDLPGSGRPLSISNGRDVAAVQLPALLPFLFHDHTAPATPATPIATRAGPTVTVTWTSGHEVDLAGYDIYRDGTKLTTVGPTGTTTWYDIGAPTGATYTVQAIDTSGNRSAESEPSNVS